MTKSRDDHAGVVAGSKHSAASGSEQTLLGRSKLSDHADSPNGARGMVSWREPKELIQKRAAVQVAPESELNALGGILANVLVGKKREGGAVADGQIDGGTSKDGTSVVQSLPTADDGEQNSRVGKRQLQSWLIQSAKKKVARKQLKEELGLATPAEILKENSPPFPAVVVKGDSNTREAASPDNGDNMLSLLEQLESSMVRPRTIPATLATKKQAAPTIAATGNKSATKSTHIGISSAKKEEIAAKKRAAILRRQQSLKMREEQQQQRNQQQQQTRTQFRGTATHKHDLKPSFRAAAHTNSLTKPKPVGLSIAPRSIAKPVQTSRRDALQGGSIGITSSNGAKCTNNDVASDDKMFDRCACGLADSIESSGLSALPRTLPAHCASSRNNRQGFTRFKVVTSRQATDRHCIQLELSSRPGKHPAFVELRHFWCEVIPPIGECVHIVWSNSVPQWELSSPNKPVIIDDSQNILVISPDTLVTPSKVVSALTCVRKAVLGEHVSSFQSSKSSVMGSLKHELAERCFEPYAQPCGSVSPNKANFESKHLEAAVCDIVSLPDFVKQLFGVGIGESEAADEMRLAIPALQDFGSRYFQSERPSSSEAKSGLKLECSGSTFSLQIDQVIGTEEEVISPLWGLTGKPDGIIRASATGYRGPCSDPFSASRATESVQSTCKKDILFPLELKTGHKLSQAHQAQVQLYSLMLSDKYHGTGVAGGPQLPSIAGLLLHVAKPGSSSTGSALDSSVRASLVPVAAKHALFAQLVSIRNKLVSKLAPALTGSKEAARLAAKTAEANADASKSDVSTDRSQHKQEWSVTRKELVGSVRQLLPDVLGNPGGDCQRCFEKTTCMIFHRAFEGGTAKTSGLAPEQFEKLTGHLSPSHTAYLSEWMKMILLEEEQTKHQRELWQMSGPQREEKGRCVSHLRLVSSRIEKLTTTKRSFVTRFERILCAESHESSQGSGSHKKRTVPIIDLGFDDEFVSIGIEGAHFGLAKGTVCNVTDTSISVLTQKPVPLPVDAQVSNLEFRVDRYDKYSGLRRVMTGLTNAMRPGAEKIRSLVVDLARPAFADEEDCAAHSPHALKAHNSRSQQSVPALKSKKPSSLGSGWLRSCNELPRQLWSGRFKLRDVRNFKKLEAMIRLDKRRLRDQSQLVYSNSTHQSLVSAYAKLNGDQRRAVASVFAAKDYICIHGMPGTGKTTTIAFVIQALQALGCSVLVTSYTHTAVDNILLKLGENGATFHRLGNASQIHPGVRDRALERTAPSVSDLKALAEDPRLVLAGTALAVGDHPLVRNRHFDFCIVDEAGQLTQPICLGPICLAETFVLVGDDKQLPPLVKNETAKRMGLDVSLLQRLGEAHPFAKATLSLQFRMHQDITDLANGLTYGGQLRCGSAAVSSRTISYDKLDASEPSFAKCSAALPLHHSSGTSQDQWLVEALDPKRVVLFLDTDGIGDGGAMERRAGAALIAIGSQTSHSHGRIDDDMYSQSQTQSSLVNKGNAKGKPDSTSRSASMHMGRLENETEAKIVRTLVHGLTKLGVSACDIGVISPYRSQLKIMRQYLSGFGSDLEIQTVDKYQGRDKEVIIVSLVRSNVTRDVGGLLRDWRRINVAFTRAKCKLIIVGSRQTLSSSAVFENFINIVARRGWIKLLPLAAHLHFDHQFENVPTTSVSGSTQKRRDRDLNPPANSSGLPITRNVCVELNSSHDNRM